MSVFKSNLINNNIFEDKIFNINLNKFRFLELEKLIDEYMKKDIVFREFEKDIMGKNINFIMDNLQEDYDDLFKENYLNISCNGGCFYFLKEKKIKIDYIITPFTNHIFYKNFICYFIDDNEIFKNIKGIIRMTNTGINIEELKRNQIIIQENLNFLKKIKFLKKIVKINLETKHKKCNFMEKIIYKCRSNKDKNKTVNVNLINKYYDSFEVKYNIYKNFKRNDFSLTTGIRNILYLLKLGCNIKIVGFGFNILQGYYHSEYYYKYTPDLNNRLTENYTKKMSHLNEHSISHKMGITYDKYVLAYLLIKFPDRIHLSKKLEKIILL